MIGLLKPLSWIPANELMPLNDVEILSLKFFGILIYDFFKSLSVVNELFSISSSCTKLLFDKLDILTDPGCLNVENVSGDLVEDNHDQ
jgi:hypothetical protein